VTSAAPDLYVAQLNVATLRSPIDDPATREFQEALAPVNALAESSAGFVWRLQSDEGDATAIKVSDDPNTIVNLTVWESMGALFDFAYRSGHRDYLRRRHEWFVDDGRRAAVWHIRAGTTPTVDEAMDRLAFIDTFGPSPFAFTTITPTTPNAPDAPDAPDATRRRSERPVLVVDDLPLLDVVSQQLITELNAELSTHPGDHFFSLDVAEVAPDRGCFLVAWLDGVPVGCGAIRMLDDEPGEPTRRAEVKRMFVRPTGRGHKIGAAVLHQLQRRARTLGAETLVLETADYLPAATSLYRKVGFERCAPWGEYVHSNASACFSKPLGRVAP
jgi:GNAT superfamily N-acetyltransferase